ncbi:hypothetical protein A2U01_0099805, partial [Trifolium medium]|nr:hypothetical protein [Trifolium medium]
VEEFSGLNFAAYISDEKFLVVLSVEDASGGISLKRKEVFSSDSEYAVYEDATAIFEATVKGSSKKAKVVPIVPSN